MFTVESSSWFDPMALKRQLSDAGGIFKTMFNPDAKTYAVDGGYNVELPGVGKANIEVTDCNDIIKVMWTKKNEDDINAISFIELTPGPHTELTVKYVDGLLQVRYTQGSGSSKKVHID